MQQKHCLWIRYCWALSLILLLSNSIRVQAQSSSSPTALPASYVAPMEFDVQTTHIPLIHLSINGQKPLAFAVDTGCTVPLVVLPRFAALCKLHANGKKILVTPGTGTAEIVDPPSSVQIIGLPGTVPANVSVSLTVLMNIAFLQEMKSSVPVAGIIGWRLIQQNSVTFDFAAKTFTFNNLPGALPSDSERVILPLTWNEGEPTSLLNVPLTFDSHNTSCILDTGHWENQLPQSLANQLPFVAAERTVGADLSGGFPVTSMLLPEVQIGNLTESNVVVDAVESTLPPLLGIGLLARFRVTIDFQHHQVVLERASNYKQLLQEPGDTCVYVSNQQNHWRIVFLKPGSAAQSSGLQIDDEIVSINGTDVKTLSLGELHALLDGMAGTRADVIVEHDNQRRTVSYLRRRSFASNKPVGTGISWVQHHEDRKLFITRLSLNSPAVQAGIKVNDQVLKVNNLDVATTPFEQLLEEAKKPEGAEIFLLIQRDGKSETQTFKVRVGKLQQ